MTHVSRTWRFLLAAVAVAFVAPLLNAQSTDLVEELRRVIGLSADDGNQEAIDFRREKIKDITSRMKTIGQLRRSLMLDDWKDTTTIGGDKVKALDTEIRRLIGEKLKLSLEKMASHGNANARLAVANTIAEMGPTVRGIDANETGGYARTLTPLVVQLSGDPDLGVRQEALRALGNINGPPKEVTGVFRKTIQSDKDVGPRRLSADGLQQLVTVIAHLQKKGQTTTGVEAKRKDLLDVLEAVMPVASVGVQDPDADVRMLSLQAVQKAGQALSEILDYTSDFKRMAAPPPRADGFGPGRPAEPGGLQKFNDVDGTRKAFPPPGRVLNANERAKAIDAYNQVEADLKAVKPMLDSIRNEVTTYAQALRDPEPRVRLAAIRAFENLGNARLRLLRRAYTLPTLTNDKGEVTRSPMEFVKDADFLTPVLDRDMPQVITLLRDPDVRIRRSAAEALEVLEAKAAPAIAGLILATQDPDRFVRWTAAKTLGYMPADKSGPAIMPLAKLLSDSDLNVRIAAANSLEAIGAVAKDAIGAVCSAASSPGDVEARLGAMYAMISIGPNAECIPPLVKCLSDRDPRIIKTACEVLGEIGPPAASAIPELRKLIGHEDPDVRAAASDAITSILRQP